MSQLRLSVKMTPRPEARNPADGDLIVEIPGYGTRRIPHRTAAAGDAAAPVVEIVGRICPPRPTCSIPPRPGVAMLQVECVRYADGSSSGYLGNCFPLEGPEAIEDAGLR
jgi:hypothetical protein